MRSDTAKKILSETSEETKDKVREYGELRIENDRLHSEIREFKLLVREYFQTKSAIWYAKGDRKRLRYNERKDDLERQILTELERFTLQDVKELPFKD